MKHKEWKIDCEYFAMTSTRREGIGGSGVRVRQPRCDLDGAPNNPASLDRPFHVNCADCPQNKWANDEAEEQ